MARLGPRHSTPLSAANSNRALTVHCSVISQEISLAGRYASNGEGFSVGFDRQRLEDLPPPLPADAELGQGLERTELHDVVYEEGAQRAVMEQLYDAMKHHLDVFGTPGLFWTEYSTKLPSNQAIEARSKIGQTMAAWIGKAFSIKGEAFKEEIETRVVNTTTRSSRALWYRTRGNMLIPYMKQPFVKKGETSPIVRVILGPVNWTPTPVVRAFLEANGVSNALITKSRATYQR